MKQLTIQEIIDKVNDLQEVEYNSDRYEAGSDYQRGYDRAIEEVCGMLYDLRSEIVATQVEAGEVIDLVKECDALPVERLLAFLIREDKINL